MARKHLIWLVVISILAAASCGGGGGGSAPVTTVQYSVFWGERSRALVGPSSALSMALRITNAGIPNGDFVHLVNRGADTSAHESIYVTSEQARSGTRLVTATFYAGTNGTGSVVGVASGPMNLRSTGILSGTILTAGTVASVEIPANQSISVGQTEQLTFTARSSSGDLVAVSPGSGLWTVQTGADKLTFENGFARGTAAGFATTTVTVDGVTSSASQVQILTPIAFVSNRAGPWNIFTMFADGTNVINLTNSAGDDYWPTWSPEGTQLGFMSNRSGNYEIYSMNADGSSVLNLTNDTSWDAEPDWSPLGDKILFATERSGDFEIYSMNANGSNPTNLTNNAAFDYNPSWSPNGALIAFTSNRNGSDEEIYVMNANGTGQTRITTSAEADRWPDWSPDGSKFVFTSNRNGNFEIYVMNANGSNQIRLTNNVFADTVPKWNSDGTKISFTSNRDGNDEIYIMNPDGSDVRRLTNVGTQDVQPAWRPH